MTRIEAERLGSNKEMIKIEDRKLLTSISGYQGISRRAIS
jgi:hypothetical protein